MLRSFIEWCSAAFLLLAVPASAAPDDAGNADLYGGVPPVSTGDPADPVTVAAPLGREAPHLVLSALGEYGLRPVEVVKRTIGPDGTTVSPAKDLINSVAGLDLGVRWTPTWRLSFAASVPLLMVDYDNLALLGATTPEGSILTPGPLRLSVPIGILGASQREGVGLAVAPFVNHSTGHLPLLYEPGFSGGAQLLASWRSERVALDLAEGVLLGSDATYHGAPLRGVASNPFGAAVAVSVAEGWWVAGEARGLLHFVHADDPPGPSVEAFATLRGSFGRASIAAGGGTGALRGPGAAAVRAFAGVTWASDAAAPRPDGKPPSWTFVVDDPRGVPILGARVVSGTTELGTTNTSGELEIARSKVRWGAGVTVSAARHVTAPVARPGSGAPDRIPVHLDWEPTHIEARVTDSDGRDVAVQLVATSTTDPTAPPLSGDPGQLKLPPGTWDVTLVPPAGSGLASQTRRVVVGEDGEPPRPLDAVAIPDQGGGALTLQIKDPDNRPIVGARILIDGLPVGTTADGGYISVSGLAAKDHVVTVQHEDFTEEKLSLSVTGAGAAAPADLVLQRQPGTVRVTAHDGEGKAVPDAIVRFVGPSRLAPMALGATGERTQVLSAGQWVAVVSSSLGVQERDVVVPPDRYEVIEVPIVFQSVSLGMAELDLRVVDPNGDAIEGAQVRIGGADYGSTSTGGTVHLNGLQPGHQTLEIRGADLKPFSETVDLTAGVQDHLSTVSYVDGTVDVVVRGPEGTVRDALVRFAGPADQPTGQPGPNGRLRTHLPPGDWTVVVSSGQFGIQERGLHLAKDDGNLHVIEFVLTPVRNGLANLDIRVIDPAGVPLEGMEVRVDSAMVGRTSTDGRVRLLGLQAGIAHKVRVDQDPDRPYGALETQSTLREGENHVEMALDWSSYAVRVRARSGLKPVQDAVVRLVSDTTTTHPYPLDKNGEVEVPAHPGLWLAIVSTPTGVAQEDFEVKTKGLTTVEVSLRPADPTLADLLIRVVDPRGQPIDDAIVTLGGQKLGEGEVNGVVLARGLAPGPVQLEITASGCQPASLAFTLSPGESERLKVVLQWVTSAVRVRTYGPDGEPIDATVSFRGPADRKPLTSGPTGQLQTELLPGHWTVFAVSGDLAAEAPLEVIAGDEPRPVDLNLKPSGAVMAGESVQIKEMVQFDFNKATLRDDSVPILTEVARVLRSQPDLVRVEVQGHTDAVGSAVVNAELSQARAEAVVAALAALGVPRETMYARGYGQTRPIADNGTDDGRAANRRVQFEVQERGVE